MADSTKTLVSFVKEQLVAQADPIKAVEMAAYMKTEMPFFGVQKPDRTAIYKEAAKRFPPKDHKEYERNVLALWKQPHREEKYTALDYASKFPQFISSDSMELYENLIRTGAWWDFVDTIAINLVGHAFRDDRETIEPTVLAWRKDDDMWIRRTSIICHNHHKAQTDQQLLFQTCLMLADEKEFFIRKAIGWALREYSYIKPDAVQKFVDKHQSVLSNLSRKEALKRMSKS